MKKFLGIDYGSKRIGIAISDEGGKVAFPKTILNNDKKLFENLEKIIKSEKVSEIVLGESLNYTGEKNEIMKKVEKFKTNLEKNFNLPIHFEQEFMTSMQVRKEKIHPVKSRKARISSKAKLFNRASIDDSVAAIILQSYLDKDHKITKS